MNELRITIGLLACLGLLLAIAPAVPTLISVAPTSVEGGTSTPSSSSPMPSESAAEAVSSLRSAAPGIRAVETPPYAAANPGDLPRVPMTAPAAATSIIPEREVFNRPVAVDAGTMKAGRTTLRVAGIDPISPEARCADGPQTWPCGIRARTAFRSWLRGRSVLCSVPADQRGQADLTVSCAVGEADIGEWLVANGWAAAASGSRYADLGDAAKAERRGVWAYEINP